MKRLVFVAALILAGSFALAGPASAASNPRPSNILIACGRGTLAVGPNNCPTLDQAISSATPISDNVTIEMMPGEYCPPTFPSFLNDFWHRLTFVGVGLAAYGSAGPPVSFSGEEAELTSFKWDSTSCGSAPAALVNLQTPGGGTTAVDFRNLSFIGSAGGPTTGLSTTFFPTDVRDVIFEGLDTGLNYLGDNQLQVDSSAFVNNTTGLNFGGEGSIDQSLIAGNHNGFLGSNFDVSMDNDTITHNTTTGWVSQNSGNHSSIDNTIVADNAADCSGTGFESAGGFDGGAEGHNLVGSSCSHSAEGDVLSNGSSLAAAAPNGGPTMSVLPPGQAQAAGETGLCGSAGGLDQREFVKPTSSSCDIGSVQTGANGTAQATGNPVNGSTLAFGTTPFGQSAFASVSVSNSGGDAVYVYGSALSGSGFAITVDGCQLSVMIDAQGANGCFVNVSVTPPDDHSALTGTLKIETSAGTLTYSLTASGGPALLPPSSVAATPGNKKVTLSWTAPSNGGPTVDGYQIQESTDGGSSWNFADSVDASPTSDTITHLTNGTAYEFEVRSQSGNYASDWSDPSSSVTPTAPPDASASTAPANAAVHYGDTVHFTTKLTDTVTGDPIANATVNLLSRHGTSGAFGKVGSGATSAQGKLTVSLKPTANGQYEWHYAGAAGHKAVNSATATVHVAQVVTAKLVKSSVAKGTPADIWGTVAPPQNGQQVKLQMRSSGHWVTEKTATIHKQTLPNGSTAQGFVFSLTVHTKGTFVLRVTRAATGANTAGTSKHLTLHVT